MGQKINPYSLRLNVNENWRSRWWPKKGFKSQLEEDAIIRKTVRAKIMSAGIVRIEIERAADNTFKIFLKVARPGLVIGRGGKGIEELSRAIDHHLKKLYRERGAGNPKTSISLNVEELKRSEISAAYLAQSIAWDLEKRLPSRRTMKKYLDLIMQNKEAQGARVKLSGRIDGAEISRREVLSRGKLPLQTLRANIDYGEATAFNTYGTVGIKVWIYKGEVFADKSA